MPRTKPAMPVYSIQQDDAPIAPTAERLVAANDNFVIDKVTGAYHAKDTPVERMHRDGRITGQQLDAAQRYYADWYAAGLAPLGAVDYERPIVDGASPKTESDHRIGALTRWNASQKALGALGAKAVVVDRVVLQEIALADAGAGFGYTSASQRRAVASTIVDLGLDILAKRYGIVR